MDGCPYCNNFNPLWNNIVSHYPNIKTKKIDREEHPLLISDFKISSYPSIVLLKNNKKIPFNKKRNLTNFETFFKKNNLNYV